MDRNILRYNVIIVVLMISIKFSKSDECEEIDLLSDAADRRFDGENLLLKSVYSSLSFYEIQKYKIDFNLENYDDWRKIEISQKLKLTHENLTEVMDRIKSLDIVDLSNVGNVTLTKSEVQKLIYILDATLYKNVTIDCSNEQILIYGPFISLKGIKDLRKVVQNCNPELLNSTKSLKFFSFDTIFIDADFDINEESFVNVKEVSFVAPKFQIIGNRSFIFDAPDNKPVLSFLGVAGRIHHRESLVISAKNGDAALFDLEQDSNDTSYGGIFVEHNELKDVASKAELLSKYRDTFRKNFQIRYREFQGMSFFESLNSVVNFYDFTNLTELSDEFKKITSESMQSDYFVTPFYEFLLRRIDIYYNHTAQTSKNTDDLYLLNYLYAATLSMKTHFNKKFSMGLIPNVPEHFERLEKKFKTLDEMEMMENGLSFRKRIRDVIKKRTDDFDKTIKEEIKAANETISVKVKEELENLNGELNVSLANLAEEIEKKLNKTQIANQALKDQQSSLLRDACLQTAVGVLKIVATGLSFAGPIGIAAGAVLGVGTMIGETILEKDIAKRKAAVEKIIPDLTKNVKSLQTQMEAKKQRELDNLDEAAETVEKETKNSDLPMEEKTKKLSYWENRRKDIKKLKAEIKNVNFEKIKGFKKEMFQRVKTEYKKFMDPGRLDKMSKSLEKFSTIANAGSFAMDIYNTWTDYAASKNKLQDSINANSLVLDGLKDLKNSVKTDIMPDLEKLVNKLSDTVKGIVDKSKVDFSLDKWDVERIFAKTKTYLDKVVADTYEVKKSLMNTIDKLRDLLPLLLSINSIIQDLKDEKRLADFMAGINYAQMSKLREHENIIAELDVKVYSAILLNEYKIAYHALEQYIFPFVDELIEEVDNPRQFELKNTTTESLIYVKNNLETITEKLAEYKNNYLAGAKGGRIIEIYFGGDEGSRVRFPFFVWRNEKYGDLISKLLRGQKVFMYADINEREPRYDAIKMKGVEFYFKSRSNPEKLTSVLGNFRIVFVHLGNSYYTLNNETYMIKTAQLMFTYPFNDRISTQKNDNYQKSIRGDFMLSPYAMWQVQLDKGDYGNFEDLAEFIGDVDLELRGYGSHLDSYSAPVKNSFNYESVKLCKPINYSGQ